MTAYLRLLKGQNDITYSGLQLQQIFLLKIVHCLILYFVRLCHLNLFQFLLICILVAVMSLSYG